MKHNHLRRGCAFTLALALSLSLIFSTASANIGRIISLSKKSLTLGVGMTETLTYSISPDTANVTRVIWSSDKTSVAEVNAVNGQVTALSEGTAKITATVTVGSIDKTASCTVNVTKDFIPVSGLVLSDNNLRLDHVDDTAVLFPIFSPEDASNKAVTWESDDKEEKIIKLTVANDGSATLTAVGAGQTKVRITSQEDPSKTADCTVTVSGVVLSAETLEVQLGYSENLEYTPYGAAVGAGAPTWESKSNTVAYVTSGRVTGRATGSTVIKITIAGYSDECTVTVSENTANVLTGSLASGKNYAFSSILSQLNHICQTMTGHGLAYVTNLSVSTSQGVLYYGYTSPSSTGFGVGVTEKYIFSSPKNWERGLSDVTFVPKADFTGTAVIQYTGYNTDGGSYTGFIRLTVAGGSDVVYSTTAGVGVSFQATNFSAVCQQRTGRSLSYVTFDLPPSSRGVLYYDYSRSGQYTMEVTAGERYNASRAPYLDQVVFLPAAGYSGSVRIGYRCTDTSGSSFTGHVTVNVTPGGSSGSGAVSYSTTQGSRVTFRAADFNTACQAVNGAALNSVRFSLPDKKSGILYYNYRSSSSYDSLVSDTTWYQYSGNPSVSNVTFVPDSAFTGTVTIPFTGYDVNGGRLEGRVTILVSTHADGEVRYTARAGQPVTFYAADFNNACLDYCGENLGQIRFDLPSSNEGVLYYNYHSNGTYSSRVSSSSWYYRSGSPAISSVTFVPVSTFGGTVSIPFTGYDASGGLFNGTVVIDVDSIHDQAIRYSTVNGSAAVFSAADFNHVCYSLTGNTLSYVRFELPLATKGLLCYQYDQTKGTYKSKVTATTSYYRSTSSGQPLDNVAFLPVDGFSGTVQVSYTGWSTAGARFTGMVIVTVTTPSATAIRYSGGAAPIRFQAADFRKVCSALMGRELSSIEFTSLPSSSYGRLYLNYLSSNQSMRQVATGIRYTLSGSSGLDQISFVPKEGYQGTVTIPYSGLDTKGVRFAGVVEIVVSTSNTPTRFTDLEHYRWAAPSVDFLFQFGIVNGIDISHFGPGQSIRRGDFVLMLCRTFQFDTGDTYSFPDVPQSSYYAGAIASAKSLGIVQGSNGNFSPSAPLTRQDAMVMIKRAMIADGQSISAGYASTLSAYADHIQVSNYARDAVSTLVHLGVVRGDDSQRLNPGSSISRAEMAVMLHRVLIQ